MTALSFTLKTPSQQRIDVAPLTPDALAGKSVADIGAVLLQTGNRQVRADELFAIEGEDASQIIFRGATGKLDFIGKAMTQGAISVEGDAGSYLGMQMKGGRITVSGHIDAYGACELRNGEILIGGNAGDFLGACLPGNKKGMAGGVVIVKGNAGDRVGDHLRRGAILIEGDVGEYLGSRMTAGTIAVLGKVGPNIGFAMGRGTLLLAQAPVIPATFNDCGTHTLGFIPLLLKGFAGLDTRFAGMSDSLKRVRRYAGDMCGLGKGEILVAQ
ncbi:formylmethanofuran dehydrogenase subunit C [Methylomagnum sp.]